MTWQPLTTLILSRDKWKFTPIAQDFGLFRLRTVGTATQIPVRLSQIEQINPPEFFAAQNAFIQADYAVFRLPAPEFFTARRLALRAVPSSLYEPSDTLLVQVDAMPLSNPSTVTVQFPNSTTATPTTVVASASNVSLLAANSNRKGATIWNNSTATLFVELGSPAGSATYTAKLLPDGYFEIPFGYTGPISGIWSAVNGNAMVRELT